MKLVEDLETLVSWPWVIPQLIQLTFLGKSFLHPELSLVILHLDRNCVS